MFFLNQWTFIDSYISFCGFHLLSLWILVGAVRHMEIADFYHTTFFAHDNCNYQMRHDKPAQRFYDSSYNILIWKMEVFGLKRDMLLLIYHLPQIDFLGQEKAQAWLFPIGEIIFLLT